MNYKQPSYFILNKEEDFEKGYSENIKISSKGIGVKDETYGKGIFISNFYNSNQLENIWNRLLIKSIGDGTIKLTYYCCDHIVDLKSNMEKHRNNLMEIEELIKLYKVKTVVNPFDILLHDAKGKYLWFKLEIFKTHNSNIIVNSIKIEFPIQSLLKYLPEVYQENKESERFLNGYLGIFQSLYMDLEKTIDKISSYFDPDITDKEFLYWLAKWVKIENTYIWKEDKLRYLIKNIRSFYENTGKPKGISDIVELYTDEKPYIIECFQIKKYMKYSNQYEILSKLYTDNPYEFTVILSEKSISSEKEYKEVYKLIEEFKPAHTEVKLIILKPYIFLGNYSYLGINSYLNNDRSMQLDGLATLPFTRLE